MTRTKRGGKPPGWESDWNDRIHNARRKLAQREMASESAVGPDGEYEWEFRIGPFVARKKNTKRWCRGVVGRPHKPEWQKAQWAWLRSRELVCTVCSKRLDWSRNWEDWRDARWPR